MANDDGEMTREEKKFLMTSLWEALIGQKWTKDDLIDFGKAIFAKLTLQDMDERTFAKIFPHLSGVVVNLGTLLRKEAERQQRLEGRTEEAATSPPTPKPGGSEKKAEDDKEEEKRP